MDNNQMQPPEMFNRKGVLENFHGNIHRKTLMLESLLNKTADLKLYLKRNSGTGASL